MNRRACVLALALGGLALGLGASPLEIDGGLEIGSGRSTYDLWVEDDSGGVYSRLSFADPPVWTWAGLAGGGGGLTWRGEVGLALVNALGPLIDEDWFSDAAQPKVPRVLFSYTESTTTTTGLRTRFDLGRSLATGADWNLDLRAGLGLAWTSWIATDYWGWYYDGGNLYLQGAEGTALTYDLVHGTLGVGLGLAFRPTSAWEVELWSDLDAVVDYDIDDHVLRDKRSTALTSGLGGEVGLRLGYALPQASGLRLHLMVRAQGAQTTGTQTQTWYADDPGTPENELDLVYTGVGHRVTTGGWSVGLGLARSY